MDTMKVAWKVEYLAAWKVDKMDNSLVVCLVVLMAVEMVAQLADNLVVSWVVHLDMMKVAWKVEYLAA